MRVLWIVAPAICFSVDRRISDSKMIATMDGLGMSMLCECACWKWGCVLCPGDWGKLLCFIRDRNKRRHGTVKVFVAESGLYDTNFIMFHSKSLNSRRPLAISEFTNNSFIHFVLAL